MDGERASLLFTSPPYANQRDYTTGGIGNWDVLMQGAFGRLAHVLADDGQILVNLGLVHCDNEWQPYWQGWLDWMRQQGWRRFGFYIWDQGPGLPGDWNGRLAPAFEAPAFDNRISEPGGVRGAHAISLSQCQPNRQQLSRGC
jgi:DNA modification methylase